MAFDHTFLFDLLDGIEHFLGSSHRKRGNYHIAAPVKGALQHIRKLTHGIAGLFVQTVAGGGFQHQIIRFLHGQGVFDQRLVSVANIAAEYDLFCSSVFGQPKLDAG